ncbi:MAG: hypothetical protein ACREJL_07085 [Candidatus Methylomirabilales bacterium]
MRSRRRCIRNGVVVCLPLLGCLARESGPVGDGDRPPRRLASPTEFPAAFTVIRAVMPLPDGRLVVSDPQENRLALIDYSSGLIQSLGRVGEGPHEFRRAGGLYRAPGGGVFLLDHDLRRLLPVLPSGDLGDVVGLPTGGASTFWSPRGPDPLSIDTLGLVYSAVRFGGFTAPTSVLLRFRPSARPDTLTELLRPEVKVLTEVAKRMEYQEVLFSPEDTWVVSPGGRVAVVRAVPYRIEWIPPEGPRVIGPIIRHEPIPVTHGEKVEIASGQAGSRGRISVTVLRAPVGGSRAGGEGAPQPIPVSELLFAKVKPPVMVRESGPPIIDDRGRLWVQRNVRPDETSSMFDVFDQRGELVERVALPTGSRLVGFDRQWMYAARADSNRFERLQRFPLPF